MTPTAFVILPDGRLDPHSGHLIPDDVALHEIIFPVISADLVVQARYENYRIEGRTHDDAARVAFWVSLPSHENYEAKQAFCRRDSKPGSMTHYLNCRVNGCKHTLAMCLASRSFPGVKTDSIFNEGRFSGDSGKIGVEQLWLKKQAEDAGVSTTGKFYLKGLASFPGDPTAWVDSRGDVLRVARDKNMNVHGYVEYQGHETDGGEDKVIADELIEDEVADILEAHPHQNPEAVREEVYAVRTGAIDNNPLRVQE